MPALIVILVRQRAKELVELLSDLDRVRAERRKAKVNRNKYIGTGNDAVSFDSGSSGRYGGFGSDSLGGAGTYGGGDDGKCSNRAKDKMTPYFGHISEYYGGSGGAGSSFRDETSRRGFEEYDAGDYEETTSRPTPSSSKPSASSVSRAIRPSTISKASPSTPAKTVMHPVPEVDLLGGLDDEASATATPVGKPLPTPGASVSLDGG